MTQDERDEMLHKVYELLTGNGHVGLCERVRRLEFWSRIVGSLVFATILYTMQQIVSRNM